jgi:hypothetical protein
MACIAGAIGQAFYRDIPERIVVEVRNRLATDLVEVVDAFIEQFGVRY